MARLGIIAGGGHLPLKIIQACQRNARDFFVLALQGQADKAAFDPFPHRWVRIGATSEAIATLKNEHVDEIVMAGSVRRPRLWDMRPDWRTLCFFARLGFSSLGDDALLKAVAKEIEKDGLKIVGAHEIDPTLITPEGVLTKKRPSPANLADVEYGIKVVKELGRLDVGQAAVVQQGVTLGCESVEGTEGLLKCCAGLHRPGGGGVLVKACKPQQDRRFDLPVIGSRTVRQAAEAGLEGIAIEAGTSMLLDREAIIDEADRLGLFVMGFRS